MCWNETICTKKFLNKDCANKKASFFCGICRRIRLSDDFTKRSSSALAFWKLFWYDKDRNREVFIKRSAVKMCIRDSFQAVPASSGALPILHFGIPFLQIPSPPFDTAPTDRFPFWRAPD